MKQVQQTCTADIHLNLKLYVDQRNQEVSVWTKMTFPVFGRDFCFFFSSEVMHDFFQQCYKL